MGRLKRVGFALGILVGLHLHVSCQQGRRQEENLPADLKSKSVGFQASADEKQELFLTYALEIRDSPGQRPIGEADRFWSNRGFRVCVRAGFQAYCYVFHSATRSGRGIVSFPASPEYSNPLPKDQELIVPHAKGNWMRGGGPDDQLVVVAATERLAILESDAADLTRNDLDSRLAVVERDYIPANWRRFQDEGCVRLFAEKAVGRSPTAIVVRLPLIKARPD